MGSPLDGLDAVDWRRLGEDGDVAWVPDAIRALGSPDRAARELALTRLRDRLVHQGAIFTEAAHRALPFLIRLVEDEATPGRAAIVDLATDLALGGHWNHLRGGYRDSLLTRTFGDPPIREPFVAGIGAIAALLEAKDAKLRASAARAIAFVPERSAECLPRCLDRLSRERASAVRFGCTLSVGLLGRDAPGDVESALERGLAARDPREATAAAIAWLWCQPRPLERPDVVDFVLGALEMERDARLLWNDGDVAGLAREALAGALARGVPDEVIEGIAARVAGTSAEALLHDALLAVAFSGDEDTVPPLRAWADLDLAQREIVTRIATRSDDRRLACSSWALTRSGLFDLPEDLRRFAGIAPRGPLDEVLDGRPLWSWLREARDDEAVRAHLLARVADRDDAWTIALCEDAARGTYRLDSGWPVGRRGERDAALVDLLATLLATLPKGPLLALAERTASGPRHPASPRALRGWNAGAMVLGALARRTDVTPAKEVLEPLWQTALMNPDYAAIVASARARFSGLG